MEEHNLEPRLSKLEASVEGINERLDRFGSEVGQRFDSFSKTLDAIGDRFAQNQRDQNQASRPQYVGFATVGIACLAVLASFAALLTSPLHRRIADVEASNRGLADYYVEQLVMEREEAKAFGSVEAQLEGLKACADDVTEATVRNGERIARLEGREPILESWLRAVDNQGSRKWVTKSQEALK